MDKMSNRKFKNKHEYMPKKINIKKMVQTQLKKNKIEGLSDQIRNIALSPNQKKFLFVKSTSNLQKIKGILSIINGKRLKKKYLQHKFLSTQNISLDKMYGNKKKKNINLFNNIKLKSFSSQINDIKNIVYIKISPNNTIITLTDTKGNVLYKTSSGKLGLNSSKKNYKLIHNMVLTSFFNYLKTEKKQKHMLFKISVPKLLRRRVMKRLKFYMKSSNSFEGIRRLSFNGCRPPKLRRKKRKGLRIFKPAI